MSSIIRIINRFSYTISPIFYKLVYMSMIATIVGIVLIILGSLLRNKISPKWMSRIWVVFVLSLLIPINIQSKFSIYNYIPNKILTLNTEFSNLSEISYREAYYDAKSEYRNTPTNEKSIYKEYNNGIIDERFEELISKEVLKENVDKTYMKSLIFDIILPYLWLGIVSVLLLVYVISYIVFNKRLGKEECDDQELLKILDKCKQDLNIKRNIKVVFQDYIKTPSIFGIFNVRILLSEDIKEKSEKEIEYIFSHELAHYKRRDNLLIMLITIIKYVYFFNPFIYIMLRAFIKDIEMATDELALKNRSDEERKEYCKTIVEFTKPNAKVLTVKALCISDDQKNLKKRITMIKKYNKFSKYKVLVAILSVFVIIVMGVTFCTAKIINKNEVANIDKLKMYENTNIKYRNGIDQIIDLLPFSKNVQNVYIQSTVEPYEFTIKYNVDIKSIDLEYNNRFLFSLIKKLNVINYTFPNDQKIKVERGYNDIYKNIKYNDIIKDISKANEFGSNTFYGVTLNKNAVKIFKNSTLAFSNFKEDYKKEIDLISNQNSLLPLTNFNYQEYKKGATKMNDENENTNEMYKKIVRFFEIYENSFSTHEILEKYPMKDIKINVVNSNNDLQSLGISANNVLSSYFETFYTCDVLPEQRLFGFVPMGSTILAGDRDEFVARVKYQIRSDYEKESVWGPKDYDRYISSEVTIRVKRSAEDIVKEDVIYFKNPLTGVEKVDRIDRRVYTPYKLVDIGDDVSTEGLKILEDTKIPLRSY